MTTAQQIWQPVHQAMMELPEQQYDPNFKYWEGIDPTPMQRLWDTAIDKVLDAFRLYQKQHEALFRVDLQQLQLKYKAELHSADLKARDDRLIAFTISPELRESPDSCFKIIEILKKSKLNVVFKMYCIEQRSETLDFDGFHIHLSGTSKEYPADLKHNLKRIFNGKKGKPVANCDAKFANERWETHYMQGQKTDQDPDKQKHKQAAALMDIEMRKKYNLTTIIEW